MFEIDHIKYELRKSVASQRPSRDENTRLCVINTLISTENMQTFLHLIV